MNAYKLNPHTEESNPEEALDRLVALARQRTLVFFFGAGMSRSYPALNPLVATSQGLPGLHPLLVQMIASGCSVDHRSVVAESLQEDPLEVVLEHLSRIIGDAAFDFLDLLEPPPQGLCLGPNYNHYSLALIAKAGFCRNFLTVNFDTLLEQAFVAMRAGELVVPEEHGNEKTLYARALHGTGRRAPHLFKLHGTMRHKQRLLTTIETVGLGLPIHKQHLVRELLSANACFFMGYRANDLDIFPLLETLPPTSEVFWFDISLRREDVQPLGAFLSRRTHWVITHPDLSLVLQPLLHRLGIDDTQALRLLGVTSLSEIPDREPPAKQKKTGEILAFAQRFQEKALPPVAARLAMADALHLGDGRSSVRDQLFDSAQDEPIPPSMAFAYQARLAERYWGVGRFRDALIMRREAIRALAGAELPLRSYIRSVIEQRLYMAAHALAVARTASPLLLRISWRLLAAWYIVHSSAQLLVSKRFLTDNDRGRLWIRILERPARLLHTAVDRQLLANVAAWLRRSDRDRPAELSPLGKIYAAVTIRLYRRCLGFRSPAFGWKTLVMRNLAMVLMHRSRSCPPEAKRLIAEARGPIERRSSGGQFSGIGIHEAFCLMYEGALDEAEELLDATYRYYSEETNYRGGQAITRYAQVLCLAAQGKRDDAARALEEYEELRRSPAAFK